MKISVVIPTYKPQEYIFECLDSLHIQTFDRTQFEILIVLNGCNQPYYSMIEKYMSEKNSVGNYRLIQTDKGGVSNARNIGIMSAVGEYVCFLDDDDVISKSYLDDLYKNSSPTTIALSNALSFTDTIDDTSSYYISNAYNALKKGENLSINKARSFFSGPVYKLIHRSMLEGILFNEKFKNGEDSLFMFEISKGISSVRLCSPETIYYRRIRNNSATTRKRLLGEKITNSLKLGIEYSKIYFRNPLQYNFGFYLTRMLATVKNIFE